MSVRIDAARARSLAAIAVLVAVAATLVPLGLRASQDRPATAPMAELTPQPSTPLVVFVGDSSAYGAGASKPSERWTTLASGTLGWREENLADAGSGYGPDGDGRGCDGQSSCTPYTDSIDRVAALRPVVVVVSGGSSTTTDDPKRLTTEVTGYYRKLRAALPDATIIAVGPWSASDDPSKAQAALESAVQSASSSVRAVHVDLLTQARIDVDMTTSGGRVLNDIGHQAVADAVVGALDASTN